MKITPRNPADLKPYKANAKLHPRSQVEGIAESIKRFGFIQPVVVDANDEIIIGHGRVEAAKLLNGASEQIPVVKLEDLTPAEVKALRILDNKLNESAWDNDLLAVDLESFEFDFEPFNVEFEPIHVGGLDIVGKEVDESIADGIDVCICGGCGHEHSKKA